MKIRFSRHAKRRIKLYKIPEAVIKEILEGVDTPGRQEIVRDIPGFALPVKVVFDLENDQCTVITAYLLKRGLQ